LHETRSDFAELFRRDLDQLLNVRNVETLRVRRAGIGEEEMK